MNNWIISAEGQVNVEFDVVATEAEIANLETKLIMVLGPGFVEPVIKLEKLGTKECTYNVKFPVRGPRNFDLLEVRDWLHSVNLVARHIEGQDGPLA